MTPEEKWRATTNDRIGKNKEALIEQLRKTPIVQIACEKTSIGRSTYYRWLNSDSSFAEEAKKALKDGASLVNDMAESQLISSIRDGNMTAVIFWLKHHHETYRSRLELEGRLETITELNPEQKALVKRALELTGIDLASYENEE